MPPLRGVGASLGVKRWTLIVLLILLFCVSSPAALKRTRSSAVSARLEKIRAVQNSGVKDEIVDKALFDVNKLLQNVGDALKPVDTYDKHTIENLIASAPSLDMGFGGPLSLSAAPSAQPPSPSIKSGLSSVQKDAVSLLESLATTRVNQKVTAGDTRAGVPPFEELPSMAPHDGLDGDSFGPLANPKPFRGDKVAAANGQATLSMPPSVPDYLGKVVPQNDFRFVGPGSSSLPPLVSPKSDAPSPLLGANILPRVILPEHPDLPNVDELGIPKTGFAGDGPSHAPVVVDTAMLVPVPPPYPPVQHIPAAIDIAALFPIPAPSNPLHIPASGDGSPAYRVYQQSRSAYLEQRASLLRQMEARRKQIEQLTAYVEGGEAWVAQKEAQLTQWLLQEKLRGLQSISGEKRKVSTLKDQLQNLVSQQKEDSRKVNLYNTEMRRAAIQFQLQLQANQARITEEQERRLQDELKSVSKKKTSLQNMMKAVNKELDATTVSGAGESAHGEGSGSASPSSQSSGA
jgi:hypothetical protein